MHSHMEAQRRARQPLDAELPEELPTHSTLPSGRARSPTVEAMSEAWSRRVDLAFRDPSGFLGVNSRNEGAAAALDSAAVGFRLARWKKDGGRPRTTSPWNPGASGLEEGRPGTEPGSLPSRQPVQSLLGVAKFGSRFGSPRRAAGAAEQAPLLTPGALLAVSKAKAKLQRRGLRFAAEAQSKAPERGKKKADQGMASVMLETSMPHLRALAPEEWKSGWAKERVNKALESADAWERRIDENSESAARALERVRDSHGLLPSDVDRFHTSMDRLRSTKLTMQPLRMRALLSPRVEPFSSAPNPPSNLAFNVAGGQLSALPISVGSEIHKDQWDRYRRLKRKGMLKGEDLETFEAGETVGGPWISIADFDGFYDDDDKPPPEEEEKAAEKPKKVRSAKEEKKREKKRAKKEAKKAAEAAAAEAALAELMGEPSPEPSPPPPPPEPEAPPPPRTPTPPPARAPTPPPPPHAATPPPAPPPPPEVPAPKAAPPPNEEPTAAPPRKEAPAPRAAPKEAPKAASAPKEEAPKPKAAAPKEAPKAAPPPKAPPKEAPKAAPPPKETPKPAPPPREEAPKPAPKAAAPPAEAPKAAPPPPPEEPTPKVAPPPKEVPKPAPPPKEAPKEVPAPKAAPAPKAQPAPEAPVELAPVKTVMAPPPPPKVKRPPPPPKPPVDSDDSDADSDDEPDSDEEKEMVWGERLYGDDEAEWKRYLHDFYRVLDMGGRNIIKKGGDDDAAAADGSGESTSVEEALQLCWQHNRVINLIFGYFCACGSDLSQLYLNEWSQFVMDFKIADNKSKFCKKSDLDRLFIQVDSKAALNYQEKARAYEAMSTKERDVAMKLEKDRDQALMEGRGGGGASELSRAVEADMKRNAFSRVEFFVALLHIAVNRHQRTGAAKNLQEALLYLLVGDLQSVLDGEGDIPAKVFVHPKVFREKYCYSKEVSNVLSINIVALRALFGILCRAKESSQLRLLALHEWMDFLRATDLFAGDLTERQATLCFSWSRSIVEDETTPKGYCKDTCLPFEGFLEALCRLSVLTAMPTDEEMKAVGYGSADPLDSRAGPYLRRMRIDHEEQYAALCELEKTDWGDEPPRQPIDRRIAHLMSCIFYALARQREVATGYGLMVSKECGGSAPEVLEWLDSMLE